MNRRHSASQGAIPGTSVGYVALPTNLQSIPGTTGVGYVALPTVAYMSLDFVGQSVALYNQQNTYVFKFVESRRLCNDTE